MSTTPSKTLRTKYLSNDEREQGLKHLFAWGTWNGLGFSFLSDTPIVLMALLFGASNLQLGYLSSIIHVSGLVLLVVPRVLAGQNLVKVQFYSWLFRGLVALLYGVLIFFEGQTAVMLLLTIYTVFCAVRMVGVAVSAPIQNMLTTPTTTGEVVVRMSNRFQISRLFSQFVSLLISSINQLAGLPGYFLMLGLGMISNTMGALELRKVPCREVIEYQPGGSIVATFLRAMKDRERALTLLVKWQTLSIAILLGFIVPFLRKIVHFPPNQIFLYTIITSLATVSAGYILRPFADRVGSRPIITLSSLALVFGTAVWGMIPTTLSWYFYFVLGFITTMLHTTVSLLASRLDLRAIPEKDKIGYVSMSNFCSALASLGIGLFGGRLADFGEQIGFHGLNAFGLTFCFATVLAMQNAILCFFLKDPGSWSIKDTASILFSTNNLKTFLDAYELNTTEDRAKRAFLLMSLGKSDTPVAIDEMQHIMQSPLTMQKEEILKTLFVYPKKILLPDIMREAADPYSYHRATAIFALGAYPDPTVERLLLKLLDDPSPLIQSNAAKSLARVGNTSALPQIKKLSADLDLNMTEQMNYLIALSLMDKEGSYLRDVFRMIATVESSTFAQTMFSLTAKMLDLEPPLADLYQDENEISLTGLKGLLHDAKQLDPFFQEAPRLTEHYSAGQYREIGEWCGKLLMEYEISGRWAHLKVAILNFPRERLDHTTTFAILYFTYQILLYQVQ